MKTISASDANRHFSSVLRDIAAGEVVTVLSRGKPVAIISPVRTGHERESAKRLLLRRLRQQKISGIRNWRRDQLYED